jgi:arylsulfatase A-like enzyme
VISLDIAATAIAAAGGAPPPNLDGVDLRPFLAGERSGIPHDALYWRLGPQKAIRQGRWKLADWRDFTANKQSGWQLFDVTKDIGESQDLAATHPEVVTELIRLWDRWNTLNIAPLWQGSSTEDPTAPEFRPKQKK